MNQQEIRGLLAGHGMKVTPQRLAVVQALYSLRTHPTADEVARVVHESQPTIATGTIYHILETLVRKGMVARVKTESGVMRYDIFLDPHHHLYCSDCNQIEDYYNAELTALLENYFAEHRIPGFHIDEVKLQINGRFEGAEMHRVARNGRYGRRTEESQQN